MLRHLFWLLTAFSLGHFSAQGQAFEPGLLVQANGDTLRGEIENRFWDEPPTFISFRRSPQSSVELFQPRQLRAVLFRGGRYFRYEALPLDHSATTTLGAAGAATRPDIQTDSLLAEVLLEGPLMLWRVARPGSLHFVLQRPGRPALDLSERRIIRQQPDGTRQLVDANNYRSQLALYFLDCPAAVSTAQSAPFTAAGLAAVVQTYYQACLPNQAPPRSFLAQAAPRSRLKLQGGVVGGGRYNHLRNAYDQLPATQGCVDCRLRPFAGFYAELLRPGRTTALYGELSLSSFRNQSWAYFQVNSTVAYYVADYKALLATARIGGRFFFPRPAGKQWLLTVGYELNKTLRPVLTSYDGNLSAPSKNQFGYVLPSLVPNVGLGWRAERLTFQLDGQLYMPPNAKGPFKELANSSFTARLGLSYRLGPNPDAPQTPTAAHP